MPQFQRAGAVGIPQGIFQQIGEELGESVGVSQNSNRLAGCRGDLHVDGTLFKPGAKGSQGACQNRQGFDRLFFKRQRAGVRQ